MSQSPRSVFENLLKGLEVEVAQDLAAKFMYQGFNADQVMAHLLGLKVKNNISDKDFLKDLVDLITLGAIVGNYNANNKTKISEEGKNVADALLKKYDIKEGGAKGSREVVNIPRVMATFPDITVQVVNKVPFERNYGNQFLCIDIPKFMKTSVFPAIIPKNLDAKVKKALLIVSTCYSAEQTMALRNIDDPVAAFGAQRKFTQLSHDSAFPKDRVRKSLLEKLEFNVVLIQKVIERHNKLLGLPDFTITFDDFEKAGLMTVDGLAS